MSDRPPEHLIPGHPDRGFFIPTEGETMTSMLWAVWHAVRGHLVTISRSPAIPAVTVYRCKRCHLVRQAL